MRILLCFVLLGLAAACGKEKATQTAPETSSLPAKLPTLSCRGYVQPRGAGTDPVKSELLVSLSTKEQQILEIELEGFKFRVQWNYALTTLYMNIYQSGKNLAFGTSRVPDKNHNDSMIDFSAPGFPRAYLVCDFVEFRP